MRSVLLVAQREFIMRVRKRSFIIATLLTPIIVPLFLWGTAYMGQNEQRGEGAIKVFLQDPSGIFHIGKLSSDLGYVFLPVDGEEAGKTQLMEDQTGAFLQITHENDQNPPSATLYVSTNWSISQMSGLNQILNDAWMAHHIKTLDIDSAVYAALQGKVPLRLVNIGAKGEEKAADAGVSFGIGYVLCLLIYMFILIYGSQVMQSVMEEKSGKIVEIMVSIIDPFHLMAGKVAGIAGIGLFQMLIWGLLFGGMLLGLEGSSMPNSIGDSWYAWQEIPYGRLLGLFLFYFVCGFLFYGAFFAAIGSAVETAQDAQSFVFPVTLPLILSLVGTMSFVMVNPSGQVSFWLSIVPLTSPVAMMARMSYGAPVSELILSMGLLLISALGMVWAAGKIFRIGLLRQGAKPSLKTLLSWLRQS